MLRHVGKPGPYVSTARPLFISVVACGTALQFALELSGAGPGSLVGWGLQVPPPTDNTTHYVAVSAGGGYTAALTANRTVVAWGENCCGECNPPSSLSNVV